MEVYEGLDFNFEKKCKPIRFELICILLTIIFIKGKKNGVKLNDSVFTETLYIKNQIKKLKKLPIILPYGECKGEEYIDDNCISRSNKDLYY